MMVNRAYYISLLILAGTITLGLMVSKRGDVKVIETNIENIPMNIGEFRGIEDSFSEAVYAELNADKHVYRHYSLPNGSMIDLYIGYYGTAKGGRTGHNPYACLPGAAWGILETDLVSLKSEKYPSGAKVSYILSKKGEMYQIVLHWYQSAGTKVLRNGIEQNMHSFFSKIKHNRNDGAFVRVSAFSESEDLIKTKVLVQTLAEKILDLLPKYWPVEE